MSSEQREGAWSMACCLPRGTAEVHDQNQQCWGVTVITCSTSRNLTSLRGRQASRQAHRRAGLAGVEEDCHGGVFDYLGAQHKSLCPHAERPTLYSTASAQVSGSRLQRSKLHNGNARRLYDSHRLFCPHYLGRTLCSPGPAESRATRWRGTCHPAPGWWAPRFWPLPPR